MHERLKETAGDGGAGKAGGVALFVRRLIHRELEEPQKGGNLADLQELAARVEDPDLWKPERTKDLQELFCVVADIHHDDPDLVRRNYAAQVLGRLSFAMFNRSRLAFCDPQTKKS